MYGSQNFSENTYFSDGEFELDFPDDLSFQSDVIFNSASSGKPLAQLIVSLFLTKLLYYPFFRVGDALSEGQMKSAPRKRGSKFMRKAAASYPPKLALRPKVTKTGVRTLLPNMSRRTRDTMLYAFPSFDRCDSLLFFPSTLARFMNAGDVPSMSKLFEDHFHKLCTIGPYVGCLLPRPGLAAQCMSEKMAILEQLQPDRITCMRSTQVDGNLIKAVLYMKYLNVPLITEAVAKSVKNVDYSPCFQDTWQKHLRRKLLQEDHAPDVRDYYLSLIDRGCTILVYSRMDMILTIDDRTKKVKHFSVTVTTTSMEEVVQADSEDSVL